MKESISQSLNPRVVVAVIVVLLVGAAGSYLYARSNAQSLTPPAKAPSGLLKPVSLGIAPYQYVAYSGSLDETRQATGVKQYFAAFVIADGSCKPSWGGSPTGGLDSPRAAAIQTDLMALRAQGGDAAISFGGSNGTELAQVCGTPAELAAAYAQVIDKYQAKRVDFDIEGPALSDKAGNQRRAEAIASLQKTYPDLRVWVTLPVHTKGLTADGQTVLADLITQKVKLSGINIMAMNYNIKSKDMGKQAIIATQASFKQLAALFPNDSDATIWKSIMITVMAGHNNTTPETLTLADARVVRVFATQNGVGTLSVWNVARDVQCPDPATPQPSVSCSGVTQKPYDFIKALTIPASN